MSPSADLAFSVDRRDAERPFPGADRRNAARYLSATFIFLVMLALAAGAWVAGRIKLYTPGSDFGYYLGIVGSIFMLALLFYPLRKRLFILRNLGDLRTWFMAHMFLGIAGPVLVLYHSTLKLGSVNAAVAFYSMLVVTVSGIVGRFIYTKIHYGLYGRQATLRERQAHLGLSGESLKSKFHFAPRIEERLKALEAYTTGETRWAFFGVPRLVAVTVRVRWVYWQSMREMRRILLRAARRDDWEPKKLAHRLRVARRILRGYLFEVKEVAQFRTYENLFSLWHLLHVPFVYMLVLSAIVHVVAVHMY